MSLCYRNRPILSSCSINGHLAKKYYLKKQFGFALLELMLSCALGLLLLAGLMQAYLAVKKTYILQDTFMSLTENGRFAAYFLRQEVLMAGYAGCEESEFVNQDAAIEGYQNSPPAFLQDKIIPGTDSIMVGRCRRENGKEQFSQHAFIISATSRKDVLGNKILALYDAPVNGNKQELVSDVTAMKISYGIADGEGENIAAYLPAIQVKDWHTVRAVEIALLTASEQPVYFYPQPYNFAGQAMPPDRFLHSEWDVYVKLRERK